ncbi:MAG: serine/threonine protein kinase [Deltaproteobacteria bacterium]|nr:serine/threonine protein kinase [Deltaproteobacteria bacterium]
MPASGSSPPPSPARSLRQTFLAGPADARPQTLETLLRAGGVLLSNDEELLAHVDFWLAFDPLNSRMAPVAARQVESSPADRTALLVRGAAGRIRDRIRAASLLGHVAQLDEETDAVLRGLLSDPIPAVGRAAGRSVWRQLVRGAAWLDPFVAGTLASAGDNDAWSGPRRSLAKGLAAALLADPAVGAPWLRHLWKHPDPWTRVAVAEAAGQACALPAPDPVVARVLDEALAEANPEILAGLATGVRDGGRATERRATATVIADRILGVVGRCRATTPEEQFDLARARRSAQAAAIPFDGRMPDGPDFAFGPRLERVLGLAAAARPDDAAHELILALEAGAQAVAGAAAALDATDRAGRVAATGLVHEIARRLLVEDQCGPALEVVARGSEARRQLRAALRTLHWKLLGLIETMCGSTDFLVLRESVRTLAAAMDSGTGGLRDRVTLLVDRARNSRTRRPAAGALARLLSRLRLDDPIGFLDVSFRLALQPAKVQQSLLQRVSWFLTDAATRSFLGLILRTVNELGSGAGPRDAAAALHRLLDAARSSESDADPATLPAGPATVALRDLASALRWLGGDVATGSLERLGEVIAVLGRCEANLDWDQEPPDAIRALAERAAGLGRAPEPPRLKSLGLALEKQLSGVAAVALARALRRAARSRRASRPAGDWAHPQPGDVFHGYRLLRLIQTSNCSTVGVGLRPGSHRAVLLKLPTPQVWQMEETREQFLHEGRLLRVLPSEHLVRVEDLFEAGPPMLVIQYLRGKTLDAHLGAGRTWLLRRCLEVLRGLRHVHDLGVVHRDLKPENVMVVPSGRAVLFDFGVAWVDPRVVTGEGAVAECPAGTPYYMAPEQWRWEAPSAASDVYALGVMLYEILVGRRPFERADLEGFRRAHQTEPPPPLPRDVPAPLVPVVLAMLGKDPSARPSLERVREAIEDSLAPPAPGGVRTLPPET